MSKKITFEDVIDTAIMEGFNDGVYTYIQEVENEIMSTVLINEAGGIENVVSEMMESVQ